MSIEIGPRRGEFSFGKEGMKYQQEQALYLNRLNQIGKKVMEKFEEYQNSVSKKMRRTVKLAFLAMSIPAGLVGLATSAHALPTGETAPITTSEDVTATSRVDGGHTETSGQGAQATDDKDSTLASTTTTTLPPETTTTTLPPEATTTTLPPETTTTTLPPETTTTTLPPETTTTTIPVTASTTTSFSHSESSTIPPKASSSSSSTTTSAYIPNITTTSHPQSSEQTPALAETGLSDGMLGLVGAGGGGVLSGALIYGMDAFLDRKNKKKKPKSDESERNSGDEPPEDSPEASAARELVEQLDAILQDKSAEINSKMGPYSTIAKKALLVLVQNANSAIESGEIENNLAEQTINLKRRDKKIQALKNEISEIEEALKDAANPWKTPDKANRENKIYGLEIQKAILQRKLERAQVILEARETIQGYYKSILNNLSQRVQIEPSPEVPGLPSDSPSAVAAKMTERYNNNHPDSNTSTAPEQMTA